MPPCAFEELFACREPLVASATFAPDRSADTPAARPEAPLPITSTSKDGTVAAIATTIPEISRFYALFTAAVSKGGAVSPDRLEQRGDLGGRRGMRVRLVAGTH